MATKQSSLENMEMNNDFWNPKSPKAEKGKKGFQENNGAKFERQFNKTRDRLHKEERARFKNGGKTHHSQRRRQRVVFFCSCCFK